MFYFCLKCCFCSFLFIIIPFLLFISLIMPAERPSSSVNLFISTESGAKMFQYGSNGAAGLDIFSYSHTYVLKGCRKIVFCGCKAEIPVGYYGDIRSTSALALEGIDIGAGVVDSDYRGFIGIIVINNSKSDFIIIPHQKIDQMIVMHMPIYFTVKSLLLQLGVPMVLDFIMNGEFSLWTLFCSFLNFLAFLCYFPLLEFFVKLFVIFI